MLSPDKTLHIIFEPHGLKVAIYTYAEDLYKLSIEERNVADSRALYKAWSWYLKHKGDKLPSCIVCLSLDTMI